MKVFKEPLFHFLLLAALLFVLEHVFSITQKEQIVVDQQTADFLIKQRENLELRELSPAEREKTILSYVEDEMLYSEAYKRGLDKGDGRMRRNMILKMRGLLIGDLRQPTEDELRTYFETNRETFINPETISLDQVYYSDVSNVPGDLIAQLQAGADHSTLGDDTLMFLPSISRASQLTLLGMFGAEAARAILAIDDDHWHGPFESVRGIHYVRITDRMPATHAAYEDVKSYIEGQWMLTESRRLIEEEIERLQDSYEVVIEAEGVTAE